MISASAAATSWRAALAHLAEPVPWIGLVLLVLAALMLIEAIRILLSLGSPPAAKLEALPAAAGSAV